MKKLLNLTLVAMLGCATVYGIAQSRPVPRTSGGTTTTNPPVVTTNSEPGDDDPTGPPIPCPPCK